MHMRVYFIGFLFLQFQLFAFHDIKWESITGSVEGVVVDAVTKETIAFATIVVKDASNKYIASAISNETGVFFIDKLSEGNYTLEIQFIGYEFHVQSIAITAKKPNLNLGTIEIFDVGQQLDEVTIKADKPLYVQKVDRMVINVESSILSAGSTALEVLERSPGITVNRQSNSISLVGKDGVMVMINGKISYMPQASIVQLLEGMSSDNIETIELITTPPANMDAEGNAGFINIVMKNQTDVGLNGSYSFSGGIGNGTTTQDNISFNFRKNKVNLYGNYSFLHRNQDQVFKLGRSLTNEAGNLEELNTASYRDPTQRNHNVRIGLDYELTEKTIFGVILDAYDQKWTMDAVNESLQTENGNLVSLVELINDERNQWKHIGTNLNLKHNFKEKGYISANFDYLYFYNENPTNYANSYYDGSGSFLKEEFTQANKTTPLNALVFNADYSNQMTENFKLETGAKASFSSFENDVVVSYFDGQDFVSDPTLTNLSNLDERILAVYASADFTLTEKTSAKFGLRYENTDSQLDTDTQGKVVDRNYGELFPSAYFSHNVNDSLSFNASYARRISRPTFNDMAPFVIFFDPNTFFAGNPAVQPSISNAFSFGTNYKSYLLSAQYSIEDGTIARFQQRYDEENDRIIFQSGNIDQTKIFSMTLGLPIKFTEWWKTQNSFIYLNTKVTNTVEQVTTKYEQNTFSVNSTHSFTITDNLSSELNLYYSSPRIFGASTVKSRLNMNFGIQKKLGEKWGTLRFNVNDIFDSLKFESTTSLPEVNLNTYADIDFSNRTYVLTYTRSFGNQKLKSSRKRETGAEEERNRMN